MKYKLLAKASIALIGVMLIQSVQAQDSKTLNYASSGGIVKDVETEAYLNPFTKETGIGVAFTVVGNTAIPAMEAMVKAGKINWDVVELAGPDLTNAIKLGLLEPLDYKVIDPKNLLPDFAKKEYTVAYAISSNVLVQRTDKLPAGKEMKSWADFWDVKTFPGPRTMRNLASSNIEFALLADGVEKTKIYDVLRTKEGVDRAFKKMDEIKPFVAAWWEAGAQAVQIISDGEADFGWVYNGRIDQIVKAGVPVKPVWNGAGWEVTAQAVVKGSPQKDAAMMLINRLVARPDLALNYIHKLPYPGFLPKAYDSLPKEQFDLLPTAPQNFAQQFNVDPDFWASDEGKAIEERWQQWVQQ
jgi:putative spermidine/putrescine transport system substrate-binding protein